MIRYNFNKGEIRKLQFRVCNNIENESLIIQSATWKLSTTGGELVNNGVCSVSSDYIISMLVPLVTSGDYILEVTAQISPETIKEKVAIRVVD